MVICGLGHHQIIQVPCSTKWTVARSMTAGYDDVGPDKLVRVIRHAPLGPLSLKLEKY